MPPMIPPTPMPRLTSAKLTPKYCWRAGPLTTAAMRALNAGQDSPKLSPSSANPTTNEGTDVAKATATQPTSWAADATSRMDRAPTRSVSEPPGPVTSRATTAITAMRVPAWPSGMPRTSLT